MSKEKIELDSSIFFLQDEEFAFAKNLPSCKSDLMVSIAIVSMILGFVFGGYRKSKMSTNCDPLNKKINCPVHVVPMPSFTEISTEKLYYSPFASTSQSLSRFLVSKPKRSAITPTASTYTAGKGPLGVWLQNYERVNFPTYVGKIGRTAQIKSQTTRGPQTIQAIPARQPENEPQKTTVSAETSLAAQTERQSTADVNSYTLEIRQEGEKFCVVKLTENQSSEESIETWFSSLFYYHPDNEALMAVWELRLKYKETQSLFKKKTEELRQVFQSKQSETIQKPNWLDWITLKENFFVQRKQFEEKIRHEIMFVEIEILGHEKFFEKNSINRYRSLERQNKRNINVQEIKQKLRSSKTDEQYALLKYEPYNYTEADLKEYSPEVLGWKQKIVHKKEWDAMMIKFSGGQDNVKRQQKWYISCLEENFRQFVEFYLTQAKQPQHLPFTLGPFDISKSSKLRLRCAGNRHPGAKKGFSELVKRTLIEDDVKNKTQNREIDSRILKHFGGREREKKLAVWFINSIVDFCLDSTNNNKDIVNDFLNSFDVTRTLVNYNGNFNDDVCILLTANQVTRDSFEILMPVVPYYLNVEVLNSMARAKGINIEDFKLTLPDSWQEVQKQVTYLRSINVSHEKIFSFYCNTHHLKQNSQGGGDFFG